MSQLAQNILLALVNIFNQGRYSTVADIKAAGQASGADGNAIGVAVDELAGAELIAQAGEGLFGPTPAGLEFAAQAQQQVAPAPAPAPVQPAATKGGAKKGGAKKAAPAQAQQQMAQEPAGFTMEYKTMDKLTAQELATRIEAWTLAAEANHDAGQTLVAEGLMRTVSRAQRRLRNLTTQAQS